MSHEAYFASLKHQLQQQMQQPNTADQNAWIFSEKQFSEIRDRLQKLSEEDRQQNHAPPQQQSLRQFAELSLQFMVHLLCEIPVQVQRGLKFVLRQSAIEYFGRKNLHPMLNEQCIDTLIHVIENDNEINAAFALRIINDSLKGLQSQSNSYARIIKDTTLIRLFKFLDSRIEFLVTFNEKLIKSNYKDILGESTANPYANPDYEPVDDRRERDVRLNKFSINFVLSIPQFYICIMVVADQNLREEVRNTIREILKNSLKTMLKVINDTRLTEVLQKVPRNLTIELLQAYSKFVQFFIIVLKKDNNDTGQSSLSQSRLVKDLYDQIRLDQIVTIAIKIIKACPHDQLHLKIELSSKLGGILQGKRDPVPQNQQQERYTEILENTLEMIDEDVIFGKPAKMAPAQKRNLSINWLNIMKYIIHQYLPRAEGTACSPLEKLHSDFIGNQVYMEKVFNIIFKIIFDQSVDIQVHEKALDLIKQLLEQFYKQEKYFIDKQICTPSQDQQSYDQLYKDVCHSSRYKVLDRLFQMIGMKMVQIRKSLKSTKETLILQNKWGVVKKPSQQTQLTALPQNTEIFRQEYIDDLEKYLIENKIDIGANLITIPDQYSTQVYTFDDEDDIQINGLSIQNYQQYVDFAKEVKSRIFDVLNDILSKLLQFVVLTNQEIMRQSKQMPKSSFIITTSDKKPYLSNLQCHYMSKILKNGLLMIEDLHDHQKGHYEILDYKKKTIVNFMAMFANVTDSINFKNIFEPNTPHILRISVNLSKTCPEQNCIPHLFQETMQITSESTPGSKKPSKHYIEFMMALYLKELQTTPELPTKFGYIRSNQLISLNNNTITQKDQDEYISILQKLIRIPIRQFPKLSSPQSPEESIIKPLVKQLILLFIKKSHESFYPIDYLGLLLSLIKRIPNQPQADGQHESMYKYFQQLCEKTTIKQPDYYHKTNLSGVNIMLNLFELYKTGIVEIQDISAELIVNFPLSKQLQISIARKYPIFAQCLYKALHNITFNENQIIHKTIIMLDNIVSALTLDELKDFFGNLLQQLIEKLLSFASELKMQDLIKSQQNLMSDPSFKAMKVLSKLGELARRSNWPISITRNHNDDPKRKAQLLEIQFESLDKVSINFTEAVRCASEILQPVLENQLASYLFKQSSIQHSYQVIKLVILQYFRMPISMDLYHFNIQEGQGLWFTLEDGTHIDSDSVIHDEEVMNQVIKIFFGLCNINNIIQTLTTNIFTKIKEDIERIITTLSELFFTALADRHLQLANSLTPISGVHNQLQYAEQHLRTLLNEQSVPVKWIQHLIRGLSKRFLLTAEENLNLKDYYVQQHEFIWNQLLMNNCIQRYKAILSTSKQMWAADIFYTSLVRLLEECVFDKFLKSTQLSKEDDRKRKIQIVQSFGGTMIPSEGLNYRSICIELLSDLQTMRPSIEQYDTLEGLKGLPYIPDIRLFQAGFLFLRQLPEIMRLISQNITRQLLIVNMRIICQSLKPDSVFSEQFEDLLRQVLTVVIENIETPRKSVFQMCIDMIEECKKSVNPFNINLSGGVYPVEQSPLHFKDIKEQVTKITFEDLLKQNSVLGKLAATAVTLTRKQTTMTDEIAQTYANGYRLLSYLLSQRPVIFITVQIIDKDKEKAKAVLDKYFEEFVGTAFQVIGQNEKTYGQYSKLIIHQSEEENPAGHPIQPGQINHQHFLDDQEYKINIEDIDFEIKYQSHMIAAIFTFLKSLAIVPYFYQIQKYYQKAIDRAEEQKPPILKLKYEIAEKFYEGLTRVEHSIRTTSYKSLQELVQQEGINMDKSLFENDNRLKTVMKPLLTCVQSETFHFVPSFLKSLKLILKIFSKVFHRTLADKMQNHLQKICSETAQPQNTQPNQPTVGEWYQSSTESLNFQMGCISGIVKLFQHLTNQLSHANAPGQQGNIAFKVISDTNQLKRNYMLKVSRYQLNQSIQKPMVKFLNTLAANHFEQFSVAYAPQTINLLYKQLEQSIINIGPPNTHLPNIKQLYENLKEKQKQIKTIRQIVSEPSAYPLREKLCRERSNLTHKLGGFEKWIDELSLNVEKGLEQVKTLPPEAVPQFQLIQNMVHIISEIKIELVQFGYQLCKKHPLWLKNNTQYLEKTVLDNIKQLIKKLRTNSLLEQQRSKNIQNSLILNAYNQITMPIHLIHSLLNRYVSIFKQYCAQNPESKTAVRGLLKLVIFSPQDKVKKWINTVAMYRSLSVRRMLLETWLESFQYQDDVQNQVQQFCGYHVLYPVLYHSYRRGDLLQIADVKFFPKIVDLNTKLLASIKKLSEIEIYTPINFEVRLADHSPAPYSEINNYYKQIVIDMLQGSSYLVSFVQQNQESLFFDIKFEFLRFGYELLNKSDKLVSFYATLYFMKFLSLYGMVHNDPLSVPQRLQKFYTKAIKQLEESGPSEHELNVLCKKIIQVALPILDQQDQDQKQWLQSTQQQLKQDQNQSDAENIHRACRFWQNFIRNHHIFKKYQNQFTIHIINSMQQIGFHNPNMPIMQMNQQNHRRIALDMAFLQIEWRTEQIRKKLLDGNFKDFRDGFSNMDQASQEEQLSSEIYQSFFIKQALRASSIEDFELQKRSLYLLKKILMISPLTIQKLNLEAFRKNIVGCWGQSYDQQMSMRNGLAPHQTSHFRFFIIILNIIQIILEFQNRTKVQELLMQYYDMIINLHQLPDQQRNKAQQQVVPQRVPPVRQPTPPQASSQERQQVHNAILSLDHVQMIHACTSIFKKLIQVSEPQDQFQTSTMGYIKEAIQNHVNTRRQYQAQMSAVMGSRQSQSLKVNLLSIHILKLFFDRDQSIVIPHIAGLKKMAESTIDYLKSKEKGENCLLFLKKHKAVKQTFSFSRMQVEDNLDEDISQYLHSDLSSYLEDFYMKNDDLPFGQNQQLYFPDEYPDQAKMKFHLYRGVLLKIIKMIAFNFEQMKEWKEQQEYLQILIQILESVSDYELKQEIICILRLLFINPNDQFMYELGKISKVRVEQVQKEKEFKINKSTVPYEVVLKYFFEIGKFQRLFDRKLDQRTSDSMDNQQQKIQDQRILKQYFMFLCELLIQHPDGFFILKGVFDNYMRDFRRLMQVLSKLSNCVEYLTYFYKRILHVFGYHYDRYLQFVLGTEENFTEGEEILLMASKLLILGRGELVRKPLAMNSAKLNITVVPMTDAVKDRQNILEKYISFYQRFQKNDNNKLFITTLKLLTSEYLPSMVIYSLSHIPVQDTPQQPLRECILPSAALELMGTAQNVSSRLLRPLIIQLLSRICQKSQFQQVLDYLLTQPISFSVQGTLLEFVVQYINKNGWKCLASLTKYLLDQNQVAIAQYLCERSNDPEASNLLALIAKDSWDKELLQGVIASQVTQEQVKRVILLGQLREPAQQVILVNEIMPTTNDFWDQETNAFAVQREIEEQVLTQQYNEALQQLSQWGLIRGQNRIQTIETRMDAAIRDKSKEAYETAYLELKDLKLFNSSQNDYLYYTQALFRLMDFVKEDTVAYTGSKININTLAHVEHNLKNSQIINAYNFIKFLPRQFQSYDQMQSSPLYWGNRYLHFVSQFQLYVEIDETLRQFDPNKPYNSATSAYPFDQMLESMQSSYTTAINNKKLFQERMPTQLDPVTFQLDIIAQRSIQQQISFQRFVQAAGQFTTNAQTAQIDHKNYHFAFLDHKNLLYPFRMYNTDEQVILKDIPRLLHPICEKFFQVERIKRQKFKDIDENLKQLQDIHDNFLKKLPNTNITSSEEIKNILLIKVLKLKLYNMYYKTLRLDSDSMEIERTEKLETLVEQTSSEIIKYQLNHFKFWKDIQALYKIAHKKYQNNIQFAANLIQATPLAIQYKPQRFPYQIAYVLYVIASTKSDTILQDAFETMSAQVPLPSWELYIPQLIGISKQNPNDRVRKVCEQILSRLKDVNYSKYEEIQSKFADFFLNIYQHNPLEELLYLCVSYDISAPGLKIVNFLQTHQQIREQLNIDQKAISPLRLQTKIQNQLKIINEIHGAAKALLLQKLQPYQMSITQVYQFQLLLNNSPMFGCPAVMNRNGVFNGITIKNIYPTVQYRLINNKKFIRIIALLGSDDKKYYFALTKGNRIFDPSLERLFAQQMLTLGNMNLREYKESRIRNLSLDDRFTYHFQGGLRITPIHEEDRNITHFIDDIDSISHTLLHNQVQSFAKTLETFIAVRKILIKNIAAQFAMSYIFAYSGNRQLEHMNINLSNGNFFFKGHRFQIQNHQLRIFDPFAFRYSRNFQFLITEENKHGIFIPAFTAVILAFLKNEHFREYVNLICFQMQCSNSEAFYKKLHDTVYKDNLICSKAEQLIDIATHLYSQDVPAHVRKQF